VSGGVLVVSDLHAHAWPRFATTERDGTNSRFADLLRVLDQVETYVDEYQPSALLVLGDLTHRRYYVNFSIYTPLVTWLSDMNKRVPVVCMVGNHDIEARGHHALGPLRLMDITIVDDAQWINVPDFGWVRMIPYMNGDAVATFARMSHRDTTTLVTSDPKIAFLHYALDGHVLGEHEYALPSPLRLSDLDAYDKIVLGHVHTPAVESDGRVIYVGAPMHFDFGDRGPRYCWLFETPTSAPRALELHAPAFMTATYPRVPLPPLEHSGFLRVLNVPRDLVMDVKRSALDLGWLDCVTYAASMPSEAVALFQRHEFGDEQSVRDFVTQRYGDVDEATREQIAAFGLDCLREARESRS